MSRKDKQLKAPKAGSSRAADPQEQGSAGAQRPAGDAVTLRSDDAEPADAVVSAGEQTAPSSAGDAAEPDRLAAPPVGRTAAMRAVIGAAIALLGGGFPFLLMASDRHWTFSVPVGALGCIVAAFGILEALGAFQDLCPGETTAVNPATLGSRLLELGAAAVSHIVALRLAVGGALSPQLSDPGERPWLPIALAALLVTASFLWALVALYRTVDALGVWQSSSEAGRRNLLQRHGFWLIVITTLIYLPLLGSFSLSDPWETHYGEVTRELLARDDWISLWWAQDGWFWSKPVLTFWLEGLSCSLLGVPYAPDQVISSVAEGRFPSPEWALRMPTFLFTLGGVYLLYRGVARIFGRRAALLGSLVLITTPYWFLLAHQSMTDMIYVGPLTAATGLFLLGFSTDPEARVRVYAIPIGGRQLRVSAYHLLFGLLLLCVLPQVLYLLSRNVTLQLETAPYGFRPHLDEFFSGSGGGNCGLPGNRACRNELPVNRAFQPALAALLWSAVTAVLLWANRRERRSQRLYFIGAWLCVVLSAMGKGAPGLVLGVITPLLFIATTRRYGELARLELGTAVLVFGCLVLPWYVQMQMRHGTPFTDRLLFHDMYKRAFVHVHDTNQGVDVSFRYYVWQLGYGLFPWTGLAAGGLVWWQRAARSDSRRDAAGFLCLWFLVAFSMFAVSRTKFHHYVLPAVPPVAMLTGLLLDDALNRVRWPQPRRFAAYLVTSLGATVLLVGGTFLFFPGSVLGYVHEDGRLSPGSPWLGGLVLLVGAAAAVAGGWFALRSQPAAAEHVEPEQRGGAMLGAVGIAAGALLALVGRDLFISSSGRDHGPIRLMHLFTYNYSRPWPPSVNFDSVLIAFTCVSAVLCALLLVERVRPHLVVLLGGVGLLWVTWGVNVYLVRLAPHWGQRETVTAYYLDRDGPEQQLVAYQMNWKGENFYTGNRLPAFVSSGAKFKKWVKQQRASGTKVLYFTTEHSRIKSLKRELGPLQGLEVLTTEALNNKFTLARVRL